MGQTYSTVILVDTDNCTSQPSRHLFSQTKGPTKKERLTFPNPPPMYSEENPGYPCNPCRDPHQYPHLGTVQMNDVISFATHKTNQGE